MRIITKTITLPIDGTSRDFQLRKLDAFSGVCLLQILRRYQSENGESINDLLNRIFDTLPPEELRSLLRMCLNAVEVRLPAGWQPVMIASDWGWPDLEYNARACMVLMFEEIIWTLQDFFDESASTSPPGK